MYFLHHSCCCIKPSCWIQFVWKVKCTYVAAIFRFQSRKLLLCFHGQKYRNTCSPWSPIQGGNSCRLKRSSAPAAECSVRKRRSSKLLTSSLRAVAEVTALRVPVWWSFHCIILFLS